jgi:PurA ssDNA and RNA-binding protein
MDTQCAFVATSPARFSQQIISSLHTIANGQGFMENIVASKELQVERKHILIEFRENPRGRFLRITETAHGRRNSIIIPSTGLDEFTTAIHGVVSAAEKAPAV